MISVEDAYLITKINVILLLIILTYGVKTESIKLTEGIILSCMIVGIFVGHYILQNSGFYVFYLYGAANSLAIVAISVLVHNEMKTEHSNSVYIIYALLLFKFLSHMLLYRVRVVIYESDATIMWLINGHSFVVLFCDFLIVLVLVTQVSKWKLRYMHFS
jgi:hypothetical protein